MKRHSKKREQIRTVLREAKTALSAGSIHDLLPSIDQVTIYRNLDMFVAEGVIKKLHFGGVENLYEYPSTSHHHALCTECDKVINFTAPDDKIKELLGLTDFQVRDLEVTVRGVCNHNKQ